MQRARKDPQGLMAAQEDLGIRISKSIFNKLYSINIPSLVGAFLKKRVDYSHGFSSVFFSRPPELTKIVLPKVLPNFQKTPKCTCWPKELNQKSFPSNIQYRTRPNLHFRFFRHCVTFFNFFPWKGSQVTNTLKFWSPFAICDPWIWRRLGPFPVCLFWMYIRLWIIYQISNFKVF